MSGRAGRPARAREGRLANTHVLLVPDNGLLIGLHRFPYGKDATYAESIRPPRV